MAVRRSLIYISLLIIFNAWLRSDLFYIVVVKKNWISRLWRQYIYILSTIVCMFSLHWYIIKQKFLSVWVFIMFIWNHRRFMSLLTWSLFKIINVILFYFNLFFCLVLGTTRIHENNEESRYVNKTIRNCQKTHVYINWFIN